MQLCSYRRDGCASELMWRVFEDCPLRVLGFKGERTSWRVV